MKQTGYWIFSIVLHLAMISVLIFTEEKMSPVSTEPLAFEVLDNSAKNSNASKPNALKNLFTSATSILAQKYVHKEPGMQEVGERPNLKNEDSFKVSAGDVFSDHTNAGFHKAVFDRIDTHLILPTPLAQYDHLGKVLVIFQVNAQGELIQSSIEVNASDSIMKVYILRQLRLALSKPLHSEQFLRSNALTTFKAQFEFHRGLPDANRIKQNIFAKPVLNFSRYTSEKVVPRQIAEQLMPDSIDLNLINPFYVYESWKSFAKKRKHLEQGFDPFQDYRIDPDYNL